MNNYSRGQVLRVCLITVPTVLVLSLALSSCYWQPADAGGSVAVQARDLSGDAEVRVRFFAGDALESSVFVTGGDFEGLGYPDGLPGAARIGRRTEYLVSVSGGSGEIRITGIPADTPFQVLLERIGSDQDRLDSLINGNITYAQNAPFLTHLGYSAESFEVSPGQTSRIAVTLAEGALSELTLDLDFQDVAFVPSFFYFDLISAEGTEFHLPLDQNIVDIESFLERYAELTLLRPEPLQTWRESLPWDPEDQEMPWPLDAVLPGKRMQILVLSEQQRVFDPWYEPLIGVSRPFVLNPGEHRQLGVTMYDSESAFS